MFKFQKQQEAAFGNLINKTLNKLDAFGVQPPFRIMKQQKYSTYLGLFSTITSIAVCIYYTIIQLQSIINYENPSVVLSEIQPINAPEFPLLKNNFTFVLTITNPSLLSYQTINQYFTLNVQSCLRTRRISSNGTVVINLNCTKIPLEVCDPDKHFPTTYQKNYFSKFILNYMYCFNSTYWDENPPALQGHTQADNFRSLNVNFLMCTNTTTSNNCASEEEIKSKMSSGYYVLYMSDSLIQMDLPDRPYQDIITLQYTYFSTSQSIIVNSILTQSQTNTDYGLLQKDYQLDLAMTQSNIQTNTLPYNSQYLLQNNIYFEQRQDYYTRSYSKIYQVLGNVGGLWQLINIILNMILFPIIFTQMNLQMANKIFTFSQKKSYNEHIESVVNSYGFFNNQVKQDSIVMRNQNPISSSKSAKASVQKIQQFKLSNEIKKFLKSKKTQFVSGILLTLKHIFGFGDKKKQFSYAIEKILNKLDVCHLIQKINEIDKLKQLLLTQNQIALFHFIPKPIIPSDIFEKDFDNSIQYREGKKEHQFILNEEKSEFIKFNDALQAYIELKKNGNIDKVDQLIFSQLDDDVKSLFDKIYYSKEDFKFIQEQPLNSELYSPKLSINDDQDFILNSESKAAELPYQQQIFFKK